MSLARAAFGCCLDRVKGLVYVIGGSTSTHSTTPQCECYNIQQDLWTELPNLYQNYGLCSTSVIKVASTLYCFGGIEKGVGITKQLGNLNIVSNIQKLDLGSIGR